MEESCATMAHHYSGPDFSFPHGDARVDHCDLFAFPLAPDGGGRSVFVIDVHPSVGINPEGSTTTEPFAPEALYELKIDTDGDGVADVAFRTRFSGSNGTQSAVVCRVEGADAAGVGENGVVVVERCAGFERAGCAGDAERRVPVLRRLAERPVLFRRGRRAERVPVHAARTSLPTRMCAASCSKCRTRRWEPRVAWRSGTGRSFRPTARTLGCRRIAARSRRSPFSSARETRKRLIWAGTRRRTNASSRASRTSSSTRADTHRMRRTGRRNAAPRRPPVRSRPAWPAYPSNGRASDGRRGRSLRHAVHERAGDRGRRRAALRPARTSSPT